MATNFTKMTNWSASLEPQSAFPLNSRSYFESKTAAESAVLNSSGVAGDPTKIYYFGQIIEVYDQTEQKVEHFKVVPKIDEPTKGELKPLGGNLAFFTSLEEANNAITAENTGMYGEKDYYYGQDVIVYSEETNLDTHYVITKTEAGIELRFRAERNVAETAKELGNGIDGTYRMKYFEGDKILNLQNVGSENTIDIKMQNNNFKIAVYPNGTQTIEIIREYSTVPDYSLYSKEKFTVKFQDENGENEEVSDYTFNNLYIDKGIGTGRPIESGAIRNYIDSEKYDFSLLVGGNGDGYACMSTVIDITYDENIDKVFKYGEYYYGVIYDENHVPSKAIRLIFDNGGNDCSNHNKDKFVPTWSPTPNRNTNPRIIDISNFFDKKYENFIFDYWNIGTFKKIDNRYFYIVNGNRGAGTGTVDTFYNAPPDDGRQRIFEITANKFTYSNMPFIINFSEMIVSYGGDYKEFNLRSVFEGKEIFPTLDKNVVLQAVDWGDNGWMTANPDTIYYTNFGTFTLENFLNSETLPDEVGGYSSLNPVGNYSFVEVPNNHQGHERRIPYENERGEVEYLNLWNVNLKGFKMDMAPQYLWDTSKHPSWSPKNSDFYVQFLFGMEANDKIHFLYRTCCNGYRLKEDGTATNIRCGWSNFKEFLPAMELQNLNNKVEDLDNRINTSLNSDRILFVGTVGHRNNYDQISVPWTVEKISSSAFGKDVLFSQIGNGNLERDIIKASGMDKEFLSDKYITVALNVESNGYEFYITDKSQSENSEILNLKTRMDLNEIKLETINEILTDGIIFVGSILNCYRINGELSTSGGNINKDYDITPPMSIREIYLNALEGDRYIRYSRIQYQRIKDLIKEATGWTDDFLADTKITIAKNNYDGLDFYITEEKTYMSNHKNKIIKLESEISSLKNIIQDLTTRIANLEAKHPAEE